LIAIVIRSARALVVLAATVALSAAAVGCGTNQAGPPATNAAHVQRVGADATQARLAARLRHLERQLQQTKADTTTTGGGEFATTRDCGGGLTAGPNTSCPFAENVRDAYDGAPTVTAYSPVTRKTYEMSCSGASVSCTGGNDASVSFESTSESSTTVTSASGAGSSTDFCSSHDCIPSFDEGTGSIVQCNDGEWSHSGGRPGACSYHDGESGRTYP
jgi:hypothetical protein